MKKNFIIITLFFVFCTIVPTAPIYAQTNAEQLKADKAEVEAEAMLAKKMAAEELIKAEKQAIMLEKLKAEAILAEKSAKELAIMFKEKATQVKNEMLLLKAENEKCKAEKAELEKKILELTAPKQKDKKKE